MVFYFPPAVNVDHVLVLYRQSQPSTLGAGSYGQTGNADPNLAQFCPAPGRYGIGIAIVRIF